MEGNRNMNILFVVAHPDDEVLGAGATINKLVKEGHKVAVATLANHAAARVNISATLLDDQATAFSIMGVHKSYTGDFPNIQMNTVPHLQLVQFIETAIEDWKAESIYTHHPSDTNNDHVMTSYAAQAASRLFQRKSGVPALKQFIYMEVPSSTEWSFDSSANRFSPNMFVEVGKEGVDVKLKALAAYTGVMRPYPHPRSEEAITGLAAYRGVQAGCNYAEAFESVFFRT
jgi:LmbE family N-acetylglucosaminyl deacetylase